MNRTDSLTDLKTRLTRLGQNLWWSWHRELEPVFRAIDEELWRKVNHNPTAFLQDVDPERVAQLENHAHILARTIHAERALRDYLGNQQTWALSHAPGLSAFPVAYFSPEFCIHECLPVYSGGLGVLAGDHLKSCSDLGIETYGITLLYRQGYFTQHVNASGRQEEAYRDLDTHRVPLERVRGADGWPVHTTVPVDDEQVRVDLWRAKVGRAHLLLLDVEEVRDSAFAHAMRLYGGDQTTRIVQELILGVGGYRALMEVGVRPGVLHLNEGHSAFATLEAVAEKMESTGLGFEQASAELRESVVFTTHTPVEAGHDRFEPDLALRFLRPLQDRLRLSEHELLALGRVHPENADETFCMTVLALKLSNAANAVSSLHGTVSRRMWQALWPEREVRDIPIGHITNGAHINTWLAHELAQLYSDCLGSDWRARINDPNTWRCIEALDEVDLWNTKLALKRRLLNFLDRRCSMRFDRLGLDEPLPVLRQEALTIGVARRFAAYKRALLIFSDRERAKRLLTDPKRPVQVIFSGKAHPADEPGKDLLQGLVELSKDPALRDHVVVIENYDRNVSRHLLEGCDLWLNAPRRPLEACGTSGMKAVFNATLNCSTLDGWWDEAYDTHNGFAFGGGLVHADPDIQDQRDAVALLDVLEQQVIPLYYERDVSEVPIEWLWRCKHALRMLAWRYNSDRMVIDYVRHMYLAASKTETAHMPGQHG